MVSVGAFKGLLESRQIALRGQALDGFDVAAGDAMGQRAAGQAWHPIDQHGAGPALAAVAALLGPGQTEDIAQVVDEQRVIGNRVLARLPVHLYLEYRFHGASIGFYTCRSTFMPAINL
jgi:cytochrome c551/c552